MPGPGSEGLSVVLNHGSPLISRDHPRHPPHAPVQGISRAEPLASWSSVHPPRNSGAEFNHVRPIGSAHAREIFVIALRPSEGNRHGDQATKETGGRPPF